MKTRKHHFFCNGCGNVVECNNNKHLICNECGHVIAHFLQKYTTKRIVEKTRSIYEILNPDDFEEVPMVNISFYHNPDDIVIVSQSPENPYTETMEKVIKEGFIIETTFYTITTVDNSPELETLTIYTLK